MWQMPLWLSSTSQIWSTSVSSVLLSHSWVSFNHHPPMLLQIMTISRKLHYIAGFANHLKWKVLFWIIFLRIFSYKLLQRILDTVVLLVCHTWLSFVWFHFLPSWQIWVERSFYSLLKVLTKPTFIIKLRVWRIF